MVQCRAFGGSKIPPKAPNLFHPLNGDKGLSLFPDYFSNYAALRELLFISSNYRRRNIYKDISRDNRDHLKRG